MFLQKVVQIGGDLVGVRVPGHMHREHVGRFLRIVVHIGKYSQTLLLAVTKHPEKINDC